MSWGWEKRFVDQIWYFSGIFHNRNRIWPSNQSDSVSFDRCSNEEWRWKFSSSKKYSHRRRTSSFSEEKNVIFFCKKRDDRNETRLVRSINNKWNTVGQRCFRELFCFGSKSFLGTKLLHTVSSLLSNISFNFQWNSSLFHWVEQWHSLVHRTTLSTCSSFFSQLLCSFLTNTQETSQIFRNHYEGCESIISGLFERACVKFFWVELSQALPVYFSISSMQKHMSFFFFYLIIGTTILSNSILCSSSYT